MLMKPSKNGMIGLVLATALIGGCHGGNMKTRLDLNNGLNALNTTASVMDSAYIGLSGAVNLQNGPLIALGHLSTPKNTNVSIPVTFFKGKSSVASLQFDIMLPGGIIFQSVTLGPAGTAAGKQVASSLVAGVVRVIVFGLNQTTIESGQLVMLNISVTSSANVGPISLGISGLTASTGNGVGVPATASTGTVIAS